MSNLVEKNDYIKFDPASKESVTIATAKAVKSLCEAQLPLHPSDS